MRVFVECPQCQTKIYLEDVYESPDKYPEDFELECENGHINTFGRPDLIAETGVNSSLAGAVLGGAAGALGGPLGVALGAGLGSILGQNQDQEDGEKVRNFNEKYPDW
ncbi:hypothetical protein [Halanaeroarchaeum sp. HSR-CO]|uniref:hypothetical protein n=1 Tax=Halanaeroarchaeum sp. HSR-CO TaxID=2866382 RepID=UPI00217CC56B|nr:hypothetical protein [Halanaeroarchaeum sp. HSR-CO]